MAKEGYSSIGDTIVDKLAKKGDPLAIAEQHRRNATNNPITTSNTPIDQLKSPGNTEAELASQAIEVD